MHSLFATLKDLFSQTHRQKHDPEDLQHVFKKRYSCFRSLLTANNNALQAMAELEKIYYGTRSYGMAEIRSKLTTILVSIYKMVDNLQEMSGGKYRELKNILEQISNQLETIIESKPYTPEGPYILPLAKISRKNALLVGEKTAVLGEIASLSGIRVPQGFALTSSATRHFLGPETITEINRLLQQLDHRDIAMLQTICEKIRHLVISRPLPADLAELLSVYFNRLEKKFPSGCRVALRSSALGEDTAGISFAGLYKTVLNVDKNLLVEAYKEVIASKYGMKAIAYRRKRGYRHEDIEMSVGCLAMVDAKVSGVMYSNESSDNFEHMIRINATRGLARGVVDGTTSIERYLVSREPPYPAVSGETEKTRAKSHRGNDQQILLTGSQIGELAEAALLLEQYFDGPQDIEWSFDNFGQLYILQSRPLPKRPKPASPKQAEETKGEPPALLGGICASGGISSGQVFKAATFEEMGRFPEGGILVVEYPLPDWAPLLGKASAVLSENGSEVGHLATVAREFGIPALFSLDHVMSDLTNGDTITIHADHKAVYRGRREDILSTKAVTKDLMAGSPVQRILTEALQYITPLNLNDPASIKFKTSWCETLHDITRFCHEKSVTEMFKFGRNYHFDKGAARRLVGKVPLEWWVINLSDGFRKGVEANVKTVRIEDIVSIPMLAIWRGIAAVPWDGPPSISAKGLGSLILQSTMRPDLDPSVPSAMATKNYFLISRNFCNLSVRLGYHYAMIEAYISDLLTENYITFRFKGGAADLARKAVRARLLAEILKQYGFRVELRSDAILARLKKRSLDYLKQRLEILGYLTLHARQLDIVMNRQGAVDQYLHKFTNDINNMINRKEFSSARETAHEQD